MAAAKVIALGVGRFAGCGVGRYVENDSRGRLLKHLRTAACDLRAPIGQILAGSPAATGDQDQAQSASFQSPRATVANTTSEAITQKPTTKHPHVSPGRLLRPAISTRMRSSSSRGPSGIAALCLLACACASSRSATVDLRSEETSKATLAATAHTREREVVDTKVTDGWDGLVWDAADGGAPLEVPTTAVPALQDAGWLPPRPPDRVAHHPALAEQHATDLTRIDAAASATRQTDIKTAVKAETKAETHAGWGFSLWLVALPAGALALACLAWRFKWI